MMVFSGSQVDHTLVETVTRALQQAGCRISTVIETNKEVCKLISRRAVGKQSASVGTYEATQRVRHSFDLLQRSINHLPTQYHHAVGRACL